MGITSFFGLFHHRVHSFNLTLGFLFKLYSPLHWTVDCALCLIATFFIANLFLANLFKLPPTQKHPPSLKEIREMGENGWEMGGKIDPTTDGRVPSPR